MLEADRVIFEEMKTSLTKQFLHCVRKLLKSKLNGGNAIKGILKYVGSFYP